jgi:hypothetical protein
MTIVSIFSYIIMIEYDYNNKPANDLIPVED